jgi:hypothetical protein
LGTSAPKKPFGQSTTTKRSVAMKNQNVGTGGLCAAVAGTGILLAHETPSFRLQSKPTPQSDS